MAKPGEMMWRLLDTDAAIEMLLEKRTHILESLASSPEARLQRNLYPDALPADARLQRNNNMKTQVEKLFQDDRDLAGMMFPEEIDKMIEEVIMSSRRRQIAGDYGILAIQAILWKRQSEADSTAHADHVITTGKYTGKKMAEMEKDLYYVKRVLERAGEHNQAGMKAIVEHLKNKFIIEKQRCNVLKDKVSGKTLLSGWQNKKDDHEESDYAAEDLEALVLAYIEAGGSVE